MHFTAHSADHLFTRYMMRYAEEKCARPIERHKFDLDEVSIHADAAKDGQQISLKMTVSIPGEDRSVIQAKEDTLQAAIDIVTDKLERVLSDGSARKLSSRRSSEAQQDYTEEFGESDYLTEGEEEVLRQMGALDEVLDI
ncbi:MAG: HPF/RaiA family ribosome-associated protein [Myxococcota bacterium]|nr:HPF/RaiA family ribosome-associated protein [Myxococcota bacterium]